MYDQIENSLFMPLRHFDKGEADRVIARSHALTPSNADIEAFVRRYCDTQRQNRKHPSEGCGAHPAPS